MVETGRDVSKSDYLDSERKLRKERVQMKIFLSNFKSATLNLRSIPQASGQKNPHLETRNRALKAFKIRVQRGDAGVMKELSALLDQAYAVTAKGQGIEELSFDEIAEGVKSRMNKTYRQVVNNSPEKEREMEEIMSKMKKLKTGVSAAFKEEASWLGNEKLLKKLQTIRTPFPEGIGLSEYLQMEEEASESLEVFKKEDFSKPQENGSGSFGKVYRSLKKRKQEVALKHFAAGRSQDALYEVMAFKGQELPDTFVLPQLAYQVRGENVDKRFPDGSILVEYPLVNGKDPEKALNDIERVNPEAKATRRRSSEGNEIYDYHEQIAQMKRKLSGLKFIEKLAASLQAFHDAGFIHQDIKPENMKVDQDGNIRLLDNGEVIYNKEYAEKAAGSLTYMAPETMKAYYRGSPQIDIYALGITAYALLTGKKDPFNGDKVMRKILAQYLEREEGKMIAPEDFSPKEISEKKFMENPALYAELMLELSEVKIDASDMMMRKDKNPFHEENLKKLIYDASPELIIAIQKATMADPEKRYENAGEMAKVFDLAIQKAEAQLQKLQKKQKRSDKVGTGRYRRKEVAEDSEREAKEAKKREEEAEQRKVKATTFFGLSPSEKKKRRA
jgi:serine/threonine protein kinase